jgi:hypothetical protein
MIGNYDIQHGYVFLILHPSVKCKQTAEHLTAASLARTPPVSNPGITPVPLETAREADTSALPVKVDRSKSTFMEDDTIPELFRARLQDCECI